MLVPYALVAIRYGVTEAEMPFWPETGDDAPSTVPPTLLPAGTIVALRLTENQYYYHVKSMDGTMSSVLVSARRKETVRFLSPLEMLAEACDALVETSVGPD